MGWRIDLEEFRTLAASCAYRGGTLLREITTRQAALEADPWIRCAGSHGACAWGLTYTCSVTFRDRATSPTDVSGLITYESHNGQ